MGVRTVCMKCFTAREPDDPHGDADCERLSTPIKPRTAESKLLGELALARAEIDHQKGINKALQEELDTLYGRLPS